MSLIPLLFLFEFGFGRAEERAGHDIITGVPPYHAGRGTDHYAFLGVFRVLIQLFICVLDPWPPNVADSVSFTFEL